MSEGDANGVAPGGGVEKGELAGLLGWIGGMVWCGVVWLLTWLRCRTGMGYYWCD